MSTSKSPTTEELLAIIERQGAIIEQQAAVIATLEGRVKQLETEIGLLRKGPPSGGSGSVPSFVKSNAPPQVEKKRKLRAQSHGRRREAATRVVVHTVDQCPDCGRRLKDGTLHHVRQVIDIPTMAYEVTEHQMMRRHCGVCVKDHVARPYLSDEVLGKQRIGIRLMSLIVTLKKAYRMTTRGIRQLLHSVFGLHLSVGAIVEALHSAARRASSTYEELLAGIRRSACVQADETSWRENGQNHWLWSFSTPDTRFFVEDKSRGHQVPKAVLGEDYRGVLASDFYCAYTFYLGEHQRCWVHFLRDLKELEEKHPNDKALARWTKRVRRIYRDAKEFHSEDRRKRVKARERFQLRLTTLGQPYVDQEVPQRILAKRIMQFANELFTFVEHTFVSPDNNAAERAVRPAVIYRKVTGGSRSPKGSATTAVLMSMVGTWTLRQQDPLMACQEMLRSSRPTK